MTPKDQALYEAKREISEGWAKNQFRSVAEIRLAKAVEALLEDRPTLKGPSDDCPRCGERWASHSAFLGAPGWFICPVNRAANGMEGK